MEVIDNKCPSCGANLEYDATNQSFKCKHCRKEIKDTTKIKHNKRKNVNELICPTCNAKLLTEVNIISTKCAYCRNDVILHKTKDKLSMPDMVLPFKLSKKNAKQKLKDLMKNKKLIPSDFDYNNDIKSIDGIYIPFWLYTNKYKVSVRQQGTILKKAEVDFEYIPYDANKHLDNAITKSLEPFDYKDLTKFDPAFLSGFIAQKYDIDSEKGKEEVRNRCANTIEEMFKNTKSKYNVALADLVQETLIDEKEYYVLLPIYLINIEYQSKKYLIAVNGQTGKIAGSLPIDKNKYNLYKVVSFIISLFAVLIITIILRWGGIL